MENKDLNRGIQHAATRHLGLSKVISMIKAVDILEYAKSLSCEPIHYVENKVIGFDLGLCHGEYHGLAEIGMSKEKKGAWSVGIRVYTFRRNEPGREVSLLSTKEVEYIEEFIDLIEAFRLDWIHLEGSDGDLIVDGRFKLSIEDATEENDEIDIEELEALDNIFLEEEPGQGQEEPDDTVAGQLMIWDQTAGVFWRTQPQQQQLETGAGVSIVRDPSMYTYISARNETVHYGYDTEEDYSIQI